MTGPRYFYNLFRHHLLLNSKKTSSMDISTSSSELNVDIRLRAHKICGDLLRGAWKSISPQEMSLLPISGGMSNTLLCCSLPESTEPSDDEPSQVLLRLYGDQWRDCDMSIQLEIFKLLSSKDLGPKLYGDFEDGRLEEFLPAQSLTCDQLMNSEISSIIARKLASVHSLDVPMMDKSNNWLMDRFGEWYSYIRYEVMKCPNINKSTRHSTIRIAKQLLAIDYGVEINFLRSLLDKTQSPTVFSHNDLHQGNILLAKYSKRRPTLEERLVFIDFEYCSYNYRAYDIANHFCEWCFEYDTPEYPHFMFFEDRFPSKDVQTNFVRNYSKQGKQLAATPGACKNSASKKLTTKGHNGVNKGYLVDANNKQSNGHHTNCLSNGHAIDESEFNELVVLEEVKPFFMVANLLWTLWCIKSAQKSTIRFGYWEHAMERWKLYLTFKQSFLNDLNGRRHKGI